MAMKFIISNNKFQVKSCVPVSASSTSEIYTRYFFKTNVNRRFVNVDESFIQRINVASCCLKRTRNGGSSRMSAEEK